MRNLINLIEAAQLPYGYWIDPHGISYPCGVEEHETLIYEIENSNIGDAIHTGFIRVVCPVDGKSSWSIECMFTTTIEAISRLSRILGEYEAMTFIDYFIENGNDYDMADKHFKNTTQAINFIKNYRRYRTDVF